MTTKLGIDLTLSGTLAAARCSGAASPSVRLETPYVSGGFEKSGGQLYVNCGIGATIVPIQLGDWPEITVFELVAAKIREVGDYPNLSR